MVDNGSADGSPEVAAALGAKVVHEPRRGYGAAVHTGLEAATADIVCFADADGSLDLRDLPRLVAAVEATAPTWRSDGGCRPGRGVWPWHARAGNGVLARCCAAGGCRCGTSRRCGPRTGGRCSRSASRTARSATRSSC